MRRQWQRKNFDGIEAPLAYTFRYARWYSRPVWAQYTVWWEGISVVAGFDVDHPFLWYLLLWLPDPNRASHENYLFISGSVVGVSTIANIPSSELSISDVVSGIRIDLSEVFGIAITEGFAIGFGMLYSISSVLEAGGLSDSGLFSQQAYEQVRLVHAGEAYTFFYGGELVDFGYPHDLFGAGGGSAGSFEWCDDSGNIYFSVAA
jgi:hypothetical protein